MIGKKSIHMNYLDLDIICDGLFILSCLGELDIQRKVIEKKLFLLMYFIVFRKFLVQKVLKY